MLPKLLLKGTENEVQFLNVTVSYCPRPPVSRTPPKIWQFKTCINIARYDTGEAALERGADRVFSQAWYVGAGAR
jgi:hypothetical protein